jgi:RluA family pseudouridine synthase
MNLITAGADDAGVRLDKWIRRKMSLTGLSAIYRLIRTGRIKVNGKKIPQNFRLTEGDRIELDVPQPELDAGIAANSQVADASIAHTDFFRRNFRILFEDENIIVCDKPPGLVVHSGSGHLRRDSLIDLAGAHMVNAREKNPRPFLVHRLDRDTSGVILLAKNPATVRFLNETIRNNKMEKTYVALCHGRAKVAQGVIDAALTRDCRARDGTKVKIDRDGQRAVSRYFLEEYRHGLSRFKIQIETGRTHQIRVHMAHISCPVAGDVRYGTEALDTAMFANRPPALKRLYLHAWKISFYYPALKREVSFEAPVPEQFGSLWESLQAAKSTPGKKGGSRGARQ